MWLVVVPAGPQAGFEKQLTLYNGLLNKSKTEWVTDFVRSQMLMTSETKPSHLQARNPEYTVCMPTFYLILEYNEDNGWRKFVPLIFFQFIASANRSHEGQYWCKAKSKKQTVKRWMTLLVAGKSYCTWFNSFNIVYFGCFYIFVNMCASVHWSFVGFQLAALTLNKKFLDGKTFWGIHVCTFWVVWNLTENCGFQDDLSKILSKGTVGERV